MNILSLFDGISCARVALDKAGVKVNKYYASEIDKYAISVSRKQYPGIEQLGSVTELKGEDFKDIDLIIGGSPCQDLSIAKQGREGLKGSRSGLFYDMLRLINDIKPKYFVLENVNSMPKAAKETITGELFGIEPIMINAALVSAQNRKRLFWVGKLVGDTYEKVDVGLPEDKGIILRDILEGEVEDKYYLNNSAIKTLNRDSYGAKGSVADQDGKTKTLTASAGGGGGNGIHIAIDNKGKEKLKSNTIRVSGRGSGINDKHNWGTIRIGQIGKGGQGDRIYSKEGKSVALSANGGGRGAKTGLYEVSGAASRTYPRIPNGEPREKRIELRKDDKANSMTSVQGDSMVAIIPEATKKGYAVATDGQSVDLSFPKSKTRRGRVGDKAKNLMTSSNIGVFTGGAIRKLTPIECERLQSLPDNYTAKGITEKGEVDISNSQRYKALGNAFNVEVVTHILTYLK